jgi:hypothetical protein
MRWTADCRERGLLIVAGARPAAQNVTETLIQTLNGQPYGIATGPDGALWFTELLGKKIGRITTAGVIAEFPLITANDNLGGITSGTRWAPCGSPNLMAIKSGASRRPLHRGRRSGQSSDDDRCSVALQ